MNQVNEPRREWGGPWTTKKLVAFEKYVVEYLKILNANKHWETIFFDGFAGAGKRQPPEYELSELEILFRSLVEIEEDASVYDGAALRVLNLKAPYVFDYYYFIDKDPERIAELKVNISELEDLTARNIELRVADCNDEILKLSAALKTKKYAALVLLDPFGMQVNWSSIESLNGTRSDVWILVPSGVSINRMLDRAMELKHKDILEAFFGMEIEELKEYFYPEKLVPNLFDGPSLKRVKVSDPINKIAELYRQNMKKIWKHVSKPLPLYNSGGTPIFHFVFASNSPAGLSIAKYIIEHS